MHCWFGHFFLVQSRWVEKFFKKKKKFTFENFVLLNKTRQNLPLRESCFKASLIDFFYSLLDFLYLCVCVFFLMKERMLLVAICRLLIMPHTYVNCSVEECPLKIYLKDLFQDFWIKSRIQKKNQSEKDHHCKLLKSISITLVSKFDHHFINLFSLLYLKSWNFLMIWRRMFYRKWFLQILFALNTSFDQLPCD